MRIRGLRAKRVVLIGAVAVAVASVSLAVTILVGAFGTKELSATTLRERRSASPRIGNARALQASYERWKAQYVATEGDRMLVLPLGYSKGLSARFTNAQGQARLDLADGTISVEVSGLPAKETFEVWLVDNRPGPGRSVRPEAGDNLVRVGRLERVDDALALRERLGRELLTDFKLDLIVVAPAGGEPGTDGLLFGAPSLFHRLYYREYREQHTTVAAVGGRTDTAWTPFSMLVPSPAWAQAAGTADLQIQTLVNEGARLFFEETFEGNGRTCGSCHPVENNFTIDRKFIAKLPPNDPLFVAEFNPALEDLENPVLMRRFGLILENVDGFVNPGVMRGVPHTLALPTSIGPLQNATGWSGDGAPACPASSGPDCVDGSLRLFAIGAVTQHFPKTLNRVPGDDFVLPNDEQLDAMAAFQLSLGRQADLVLSTMVFRNALVEQGKQNFIAPTSLGGSCNACHLNAGASPSFAPGTNPNFKTGVEDSPHPADQINPPQPRPRDAGFGPDPNPKGGFGDDGFNPPGLVEAADTGPFFHNNAVETIEGAVDFYNSAFFNDLQPIGRKIFLTPEQVNAIALFLRVINALENIQSSMAIEEQARAENQFADAQALLRLSNLEKDDVIRVLNERQLHLGVVLRIRLARGLAVAASLARLPTLRSLLIGQAMAQEEAAKALLVTIVLPQ